MYASGHYRPYDRHRTDTAREFVGWASQVGGMGEVSAARSAMEPTGNRLLDLLPRAAGNRLRPHLEAVSLGVKHIVYEPHGPISHAYFPIGAVISLVTYMEDGTGVEVATVGREGMVGLPVILGAETTPI